MNSRDTEQIKSRMMASIDGELGPEEDARLQMDLQKHPELEMEYQQLKKVKLMTSQHRLRDPQPEFWDTFSLNLYTRIERGLGWILISIGAVVLLGYGVWHVLTGFLSDPQIQTWVKVSVLSLAAGILLLTVSLIRERIYLNKNERYRDIKR